MMKLLNSEICVGKTAFAQVTVKRQIARQWGDYFCHSCKPVSQFRRNGAGDQRKMLTLDAVHESFLFIFI